MEFALYSSGRGVVDTDCFFIKIGLRCGVTRTAFFVAGRSATRWLRVEDVCPLHFESDRYAAVECSIISPQATPAVSPDDSAMRFLFRAVTAWLCGDVPPERGVAQICRAASGCSGASPKRMVLLAF